MVKDFKNAGLFIHWGLSTENDKYGIRVPKYSGIEDFEAYVNEGGWSPKKWVGYARKMHASYITLACFHCALGYIKAWRSSIPGTCTTKRDFLGELIEEGKKYGIRIVVYISAHPKSVHFYPGQTWIDAKAYSEYKGKDYDITDWAVWQNVYCRDVVGEVIDNYPDVGGFWFDGWFRKDTSERMFEFIKGKNPDIAIIRNNFSQSLYKNEDIMSVEDFGKQPDPEFDLISNAWQDNDKIGKIEYCYRMKKVSDWWYMRPLPECNDMDMELSKFISVAANGWMPKVGMGPLANGDLPINGIKFLDICEEYLSWAGESVYGVERGELQSGRIGDGGYMVSSKRDRTHYVHILRAPKDDKIEICDAGIIYGDAVDLRTGKHLDFVQESGKIILDNCFTGQINRVIKLTEVERRCIRRFEKIGKGALPAAVELPLGAAHRLSGILIDQSQSSAQVSGSWASVDNRRLKKYKVYASLGGKRELVLDGSLSGARGTVQLNVDATVDKLELVMESSHAKTDGRVYVFDMQKGWQPLAYENVMSYAKLGAAECVVTNDGVLTVYENGSGRVTARGIRRVLFGADGSLYCIDSEGNMCDSLMRKMGYKAERAAVDANKNVYTVVANHLYRNGELCKSCVKDVCAGKDGVEYLTSDNVICRVDADITFDFGCGIERILPECVLLDDETHSVMLRDVHGEDDAFYWSGIADMASHNGEIYLIKGKTDGDYSINAITVY